MELVSGVYPRHTLGIANRLLREKTSSNKMPKNVKSRRWSYWLLIASLSAIGVATIFPFKFVVPEGFLSVKFILEEFEYSSSIKDYFQNVLLFIPLGISLAAIATRQQRNIWIILAISCLIGAAVSIAVESIQLLLPIRVSNLTDIICNSLGSLLGAALYFWRGDSIEFAVGVVRLDRSKLSFKSLLMAIASYSLIIAIAIWILLINANLSNWDEDCYLTIGNGVSGNRPWNGYLNSLYISDRRLRRSPTAVLQDPDTWLAQLPNTVIALQATPKHDFSLPSARRLNLSWQNTLSSQTNNNYFAEAKTADSKLERSAILLDREHWLKTEQPAWLLNQSLKQSSEFTILLTIATKDLSQTGPARIIALSSGVYTQNLLIGQEEQNLIFRLRTPITGDNSVQPQFSIPDLFDDYNYHRVLIIFARRQLTFYIDDLENQYSFVFTPSVSFYSYLPWEIINWTIDLQKFDLSQYQLIFYTIIFTPLIILTGVLAYLFPHNLVSK